MMGLADLSGLTIVRACRMATVGLSFLLAVGCSALRPVATPQAALYALDGVGSEAVRSEAGATRCDPLLGARTLPTLIVNPPHAASGFDSSRMIYVREAHRLEYFAHSEWVDAPARMLAPLMVAALENSGAFGAVVPTPNTVAGELRLATEVIRLQQDFASQPSRVRFTLRAYLVDNTTRRVLAWREFDETVAAASDDPQGGVVAANHAVRKVLAQLAGFCAEARKSSEESRPRR